MTRVTQLIHDAGKYLLISVYPLPTHPTHNFTHNNGGNLDTLPGWPRPILTQGTLVPYTPHSLLSPRWVNTSPSCWRQTRTPPSRTPALLGLGWIPLDLGAFNLGLIAPVTALTLGYRSAWSPGTALSHLGSASLVAQGLYSDIGLKT